MGSKFNRIIHDKRRFSRLSALLVCEFEFEDIAHRAIIVDMSLNGVLLASKLQPPNESTVTVIFRSPVLRNAFALEGSVLRSNENFSEPGESGTFVVQFACLPPELLKILHTLILEQKATSQQYVRPS